MNDGAFIPTPADHSRIRIGTAERDQALDALSQHLTAGRIDLDEFDERSAAVAAARTFADLDPLFVDLPEPRARRIEPAVVPGPPPARRPDRRPGAAHWLSVSVALLLVAAFLAGMVVTRGAVWWLLFFIPATRAFIVGDRRRRRANRAVKGGCNHRF